MTETAICPVCGDSLSSPEASCPRCVTATMAIDEAPTPDLPADPELLPGGAEIAGRYRVLRPVGKGGFGVVYSVMDQRLRRSVAIKRLARPCDPASGDAARFEQEARILARLDHPHVVPIYDAGLDGEHPYIAMKLIEGFPLSRRIRERQLREEEALTVLHRLADGLAHAHSRGILHRDLKPSNVLLDREGGIFLADFGLSTTVFDRSAGTAGLAGTVHYMAPEVFQGEVTERSDLYSLGTVLYEMLFQRTCFEADDTPALLQKLANEKPAFVDNPPRELGAPCRSLLARLLAADPGERPASAAEVAAEIDEILGTGAAAYELRRELESLESAVAELVRVTGDGAPGTDRILAPVSRFVFEGMHLAERLAQAPVQAPAVSLLHLAREVERRLVEAASAAGEAHSPFEGTVAQLQTRILRPILEILHQLEEETAGGTAQDEFFAFDDLDSTLVEPAEAAWIDDLLSSKDFVRHEAVLTLAGGGLPMFLEEAGARAPAERDRLFAALWEKANVLLLEGRGRSRPIFEAAATLVGDEDLCGKWRLLYSLFQKVGTSYWDSEMVRGSLETSDATDRRVLGRSLLFHPWDEYRRLALAVLEPPDFWDVIAHEGTPVTWTLELWRHLRPRVTGDYLKIFFMCVHDRLLEVSPLDPPKGTLQVPPLDPPKGTLQVPPLDPPKGTLRENDAGRIVAVVDLVKEFFEVDSFHETLFFQLLTRLEENVRAAARRQGLFVDFDAEYVGRMRRFGERPAVRDMPILGWGKVPLPVQRLLARRGHFLLHFSCHPVDPIAMECLSHLKNREDVQEFLKLYNINARLLTELAKVKRLFQHDREKYLLVANPKTPTYVISKHIGYLRGDSLKAISHSPECNPFAREYARKILSKRDQFRTGTGTERRDRGA